MSEDDDQARGMLVVIAIGVLTLSVFIICASRCVESQYRNQAWSACVEKHPPKECEVPK